MNCSAPRIRARNEVALNLGSKVPEPPTNVLVLLLHALFLGLRQFQRGAEETESLRYGARAGHEERNEAKPTRLSRKKGRLWDSSKSSAEAMQAKRPLHEPEQPSLKESRESASIGIVTALEKEHLAIRCLVANRKKLRGSTTDNNVYEIGELGSHRVLLASMPTGRYGEQSAAAVVSTMLQSFPDVKDIIVMGIAGGVPNPENANVDVHLGDVVVSMLEEGQSAVMQFDLGKRKQVRLTIQTHLVCILTSL